MKKLSLRLFSLFAVASLFSMTACDSETDTVDPVPTVTIPQSAASTAKVGDVVSFNVAVVAESKIKSIETRKGTTTIGTIKTSNFTNSTSDTYPFSYTVVADDAGKTLEFAFIVIDNKERMTKVDYSLAVSAVGGEISTYSARLFGGQDNTNAGSFFRSSDGEVRNVTQANAAPATIDLIYLYSGTNGAVFAAPNDTDVILAHSSVKDWNPRNATKIKLTTVTKAQFAAVTTDAEIVTAAEGASASRVNSLKVDDVFAFITVGGKKGLVLVEKVEGTTATTRSITVSVKIQKTAI